MPETLTPTIWQQKTSGYRSVTPNPLEPIFKGFTEAATSEELPQATLIELGSQKEICLCGENFTADTIVGLVPHSEGEIDESAIALVESAFNQSTSKLTITLPVTSEEGWFNTASEGIYDLILDVDKGVRQINPSAVEIKLIPWLDLRAGGEEFTAEELTYATRLNLNRDADGMWFSGDTGWDTWAYFGKIEHSRSQPKTYEWIFSHTTGAMMIGIGGVNANPTTTTAYYESEIVGYFNSQTSFNRFYGDRSNGGTSTTVTANAVKKFVLEHNGEGGYSYWIYELPSADPANWGDTSNLKETGVIPSVFNESDSPIAPYFSCHNSTHRLIAVRLK